MIETIHCSRAYHDDTNDDIKPTAELIKESFYGHNPPFDVLPLTEEEYDALIEAYDDAHDNHTNGGAAQYGPFLIAKTALMDATDKIATAVDDKAQGNRDTIILGGFTPTKERSEGVKPVQCIVELKRGIANEVIASCQIIANANNYGCFMTEGAPLPGGSIIDSDGRLAWIVNPDPGTGTGIEFVSIQIDFTTQRVKSFKNLKHDVTYYFYFFAVNATGVGPVSEVVSIVCW